MVYRQWLLQAHDGQCISLNLTDVHAYNGGYVIFAGDKGGIITGQGTLTNGQVSF